MTLIIQSIWGLLDLAKTPRGCLFYTAEDRIRAYCVLAVGARTVELQWLEH